MPFNKRSPSPLNYYKVQSAIGTLEAGYSISAPEISNLTGAILEDSVSYTAEMKCVKKISMVGERTRDEPRIKFLRESLAGAICYDNCPASIHCVLKLIMEEPTNLARLPRNIALMQVI